MVIIVVYIFSSLPFDLRIVSEKMMGGGVTPAVVVLINVIICIFVVGKADGGGKVVFAVNAGGEGHVDVNGIHYEKDTSKVGISSDYGKHLMAIGRVHPNDQILYQTERYHRKKYITMYLCIYLLMHEICMFEIQIL